MAEGGTRAEQIPGLEAPDEPVSRRRTVRSQSSAQSSAKAGAKASPGRPARKRSAKRKEPADSLPVARVVVDVPLPHLDRPFDYLVPATMADTAVSGCRVRVRFAGQLVDGYLLERAERSDHEGRLAFLERVVSPEPVLSTEIIALAREVADRYAGTLADVLRLAIPPRHATVEAAATATVPAAAAVSDPAGVKPAGADPAPAAGPAPEPVGPAEPVASAESTESTGPAAAVDPGPWTSYPAGPSYLDALIAGRAPRAVWTALPDPHWPEAVAVAVRAALAGGGGALVVAADGRDVARLDAALTAVLGPDRHVALTAGLGPAERYRRWLAIRRGTVRAVVGTRAAMFAPVAGLGLVVLWDDGDDLHAEPHAPYPHAREVLALRAHRAGAAALIGGFARTSETTQLVASGWARSLAADRTTLRHVAPRVRAAGDDAELAHDGAARGARLPYEAFREARRGLREGPVLVQVPRRGYLPAIACARCRGPARCAECAGPLALGSSHAAPHCRWCGRIAGGWQCPECGGGRVRAAVVGARRTAEELGRAFPAVPVRTSGRDGVLDQVGPEPALVVATPGAEPLAEGGYTTALLLDGWALLGRADLRAAEEALRRWMNAAALVRPGHAGGVVVVLAESVLPPVQALVRWDPITLAERELAERAEVGFPPAVRMASLTGTGEALRELLDALEPPAGAEVLGPVPVGGEEARERALVRVARTGGSALARALKAAQGTRSARKAAGAVRVQMDPMELI